MRAALGGGPDRLVRACQIVGVNRDLTCSALASAAEFEAAEAVREAPILVFEGFDAVDGGVEEVFEAEDASGGGERYVVVGDGPNSLGAGDVAVGEESLTAFGAGGADQFAAFIGAECLGVEPSAFGGVGDRVAWDFRQRADVARLALREVAGGERIGV